MISPSLITIPWSRGHTFLAVWPGQRSKTSQLALDFCEQRQKPATRTVPSPVEPNGSAPRHSETRAATVIIAKTCFYCYFWPSCTTISYILPPKFQVCGKGPFLRKSQEPTYDSTETASSGRDDNALAGCNGGRDVPFSLEAPRKRGGQAHCAVLPAWLNHFNSRKVLRREQLYFFSKNWATYLKRHTSSDWLPSYS